MAAGAMSASRSPSRGQATGRKVTMTRVTFRREEDERCSVCCNDMEEGVRCELPGRYFLVCSTCVTAMGIVLGK
jgi:hypothetical protein